MSSSTGVVVCARVIAATLACSFHELFGAAFLPAALRSVFTALLRAPAAVVQTVLRCARVGRHVLVQALVLVLVAVRAPVELRYQQVAARRQTNGCVEHAYRFRTTVFVERQRLRSAKN